MAQEKPMGCFTFFAIFLILGGIGWLNDNVGTEWTIAILCAIGLLILIGIILAIKSIINFFF